MKCEICNKEFRQIRKHIEKVHNMDPFDYYAKFISKTNKRPVCLNCGKEITKFRSNKFSRGPEEYCCKKCRYEAHSKKITELHKTGKYLGTSRIVEYNKSDTHRKIASEKAKNRRLDKESIAFNSEFSDRIRNRDNILSRYPEDSIRYLYVLEYDDKIKIGSTSKLERRLNDLKGYNKTYIYTGTVKDMANLECDIFIKFKYYTLLDETRSYYTEYLNKSCLYDVLNFIKENV